jgi:hypothetical protein
MIAFFVDTRGNIFAGSLVRLGHLLGPLQLWREIPPTLEIET